MTGDTYYCDVVVENIHDGSNIHVCIISGRMCALSSLILNVCHF